MVHTVILGVITMTATYPFTKASMAGVAQNGKSPKDDYIGLFQETLNQQFYNSSDWWTIQEQDTAGSTVFTDVDVRISHVINAETGLKLGDDWKTLLFMNVNHNIELGKQYTFNDNTWITTNTEFIKNLTGTCTIRRCNNTLRWIDEATGAQYEEPCSIEYLVKEPRNYATSGSPFITPGGFLHIEMQFNETSNKIRENQRFLFGNAGHWTCYKVIGTGLNDFRNNNTYDNNSAKLLLLDLVADFVNNELDDVTNGIADFYTNLYTIAINRDTVQGSPTDTLQLTALVTYNGETVTRNIVWETDDTSVASVSPTGLVTMKTNGTCTITATIENRTSNDTCAITVSTSPSVNSDVRVLPDVNYILEGVTKSFTVYLYEDDAVQADAFTVACNRNSVPSANYTFTQTGTNAFTIKNNLRNLSSYLTITCTSGSNVKTFNVFLKGGW